MIWILTPITCRVNWCDQKHPYCLENYYFIDLQTKSLIVAAWTKAFSLVKPVYVTTGFQLYSGFAFVNIIALLIAAHREECKEAPSHPAATIQSFL